MSTKNPIPILAGSKLGIWADKLVTYLRTLEADLDVPGPKIIQLEHKLDGASAAVDGIIMFDPVNGYPVYSHDGAWHGLMPSERMEEGTWTPTFTNGTNVAASSPFVCNYFRIGDMVYCSVSFSASFTSTGVTSVVEISLPVLTDITDAHDLRGTLATWSSTGFGGTGAVAGGVTNNTALARLLPVATGNQSWFGDFAYRVAI